MESKNLLLLAGAILFFAAAAKGAGPYPAPQLPTVRGVLLETSQLAGTPPTRVLSIAPVISLHKEMDYEVSVTLPSSQTSRYTVSLYRRVASPHAACGKQLCWEHVFSFAESAPTGSTQTRSLKQFSGDILIASWQRDLLSGTSSDDVSLLKPYVHLGSLHKFEFKSGVRVMIDQAQNH